MDEIIIRLARDEAIQMLGKMMSQISQDTHYAGWIEGLENDLPPLIESVVESGNPLRWEFGVVEVKQARIIKSLADQLGHWVTLSYEDGITYAPYTPKQPGQGA